MELGEVISPPSLHTEPSEDCPFCPPPDFHEYKTYPGKASHSGKLGGIMEDPAQLTSKQSGVRPQSGRADSDGYIQEQSRPEKRKMGTAKFYTFQAHHLISGKQALDGHDMEDWIVGGNKIDKDTGYSVNSAGNGFWAPSTPKEYVGRWGKKNKTLSDEKRQELAEMVMADASAQIHIGPHNISDRDDPSGDKHISYDKYIKKKLKLISDRIEAWSNVCPFCEAKNGDKPQTTHVVHDVLDRFSSHLEKKITEPRQNWRIFLSKYAMNYHKPVCKHVVEL